MDYKIVKLSPEYEGDLRLELRFEISTGPGWWKTRDLGGVVAAALVNNGLWLGFGYFGSGMRLKKLRSPAELESASRAWETGEHRLQQVSKVTWKGTELSISLREDRLVLTLHISAADLKLQPAALLDALAAFASAIFGELTAIATLSFGATQLDLRFPRVRPPSVTTGGFTPGSVLDLFDLDHLKAVGRKAEAKAVASARLPKGAMRTKAGRLIALRWAADLKDEAAVAAARAEQEEWITSHVEMTRDDSYNGDGDLREEPSELHALPPLTFYDLDHEVGYKAVVPKAMSASDWAELSGFIQRKKIHGNPLAALRLIAPKRALALQWLGRAREAGIDAVLYADNQGRWWNPAPPGQWKEPLE